MSFLRSIILAALVAAPLLFQLAHFPQSPDGAEMVQTATHGGVLHPSGMPLQAWFNRFVVSAAPTDPAGALSFLSWLGSIGTILFLFLFLRHIGVGFVESGFAIVAYLYIPIVAYMSVIPEKYTWLTFTEIFFLWSLVRYIDRPRPRGREAALLGLALGLALTQHSALVILVPPFLYVFLRDIYLKKGQHPLRLFGIASGVAILWTLALYGSLLFMRADRPWPDWGQIENLTDVFRHAVRQDYGYVKLFTENAGESSRALALRLFGKDLIAWNGAFLFVFVGFFALVRTRAGQFLGALLLMIFIPSLAILVGSAMPTTDLNMVHGYQERYPLLIWPLVMIFWGVGFSFLVKERPKWRPILRGAMAAALVVFAYEGWSKQNAANNNLVDLYREQVRFELDDFNIFWTSSDYFGFLGVPTTSGTLFPIKNLIGLPWYRDQVLPKEYPAVARLLNEGQPAGFPDLVRQALHEGFKIVMTEGSPLLAYGDIMAQAEQTGVLWVFSPNRTALYTKKIVANSLHLCQLLRKANVGLPREGQYFSREFLGQFRFTFLGARDYLASQMELKPAQAAEKVASVLVPGATVIEWQEACQSFAKEMSETGESK